MSAYEEDRQHWIVFDSVDNFNVAGGGTFNGNGKKWWQNSCKFNKNIVSFCNMFSFLVCLTRGISIYDFT